MLDANGFAEPTAEAEELEFGRGKKIAIRTMSRHVAPTSHGQREGGQESSPEDEGCEPEFCMMGQNVFFVGLTDQFFFACFSCSNRSRNCWFSGAAFTALSATETASAIRFCPVSRFT